jgi:hypothetical protein
MKARTARFAVLVAAVLGLMATMVPSASATTIKEIEFVGTASVPTGLGYPVITPPEHGSFTFSSDTCVKVSVSTPDKATPKTGVDPCLIVAQGTVWGHCGQSVGVGVATIYNLSGTKEAISTYFTWTEIDGEAVVTGGSGNTTITGVATVIPTSGSCTDGSATGFTIIGTWTYVDLTQ